MARLHLFLPIGYTPGVFVQLRAGSLHRHKAENIGSASIRVRNWRSK